MIGRTPEYIVAVRPLKDGVISDNDMTQAMIKEFIHMANNGVMVKPRVVLCVPSSVTDVEKRAVVEAALSAGARKVFLIEEPIAALIGAGVDISKPNGTMVVDIGGGTADVAIVSFNGIVQSRSIKMAGNKFDAAIIRHITQKYKILIGEKTAEKAKMEIGNVFNPTGNVKMTIRGRNLLKGLPESLEISDIDIYEALHDNAMEIVEQVKLVLESTPPELVGDILSSGITLTGGGALLGGLAELISDNVGAPCYVADNAIECVARGVDIAFKMSNELLDGFEQVQLYGYK
jgi:rod shape-determining protein MreB